MSIQKAMMSVKLQEVEAAADEASQVYGPSVNMEEGLVGLMDEGKETEVLRKIVTAISYELKRLGEIPLGGDVSLLRIETFMNEHRFEEILRFDIQTPEGRLKHFQGPLFSFRECRTAEDFVLRGLGYAEE